MYNIGSNGSLDLNEEISNYLNSKQKGKSVSIILDIITVIAFYITQITIENMHSKISCFN